MKITFAASRYFRFVLLIALLFQSLLIPSVRAELVTSDMLLDKEFQESRRDIVFKFIQRDEVVQQMKMLGIDENEARQRVDSLTDEEISYLADHIEDMPYGSGHATGSVIGALLFVFIVLLITDILGLTKVFPFTRPVR
jgi:hypothetical protein